MIDIDRMVSDYFARMKQPHDSQLDASYQFQIAVRRDMLRRLSVAMDDEGVPEETAVRLVRSVLYGAPSAAEAEQRMRQQEAMVKLVSERSSIVRRWMQPSDLDTEGGTPS